MIAYKFHYENIIIIYGSFDYKRLYSRRILASCSYYIAVHYTYLNTLSTKLFLSFLGPHAHMTILLSPGDNTHTQNCRLFVFLGFAVSVNKRARALLIYVACAGALTFLLSYVRCR